MRAYKNAHLMGDRLDTMTRKPKEQIIELSKLMSSNPRISTPTNSSTGEK